MAKYDPLRDHLAAQSGNEVRMTFAEVEALVGSLPSSARKWGAWWANSSLVQAQAWREAGWHVAQVDRAGGQVVFERGVVGGTRIERVALQDLMDAGLLLAGSQLTCSWRGDTYRATVTTSGGLKLQDGRTFETPSAAASAVMGGIAINGWSAWRLDGQTLNDLRVRLRDRSTEDQSVQDRYNYLDGARARAEAGNAEATTVAALLGWWGADNRDPETKARVDEELAAHGLVTDPDYRDVILSTVVRLTLPTPDPDDAPEVDPIEEGRFERGLKVGNLPSAESGLVSIDPAASLNEAITLMGLNSYSQLAVKAGRKLYGVVTWRSIAEARNRNEDCVLRDAIVPTETVRYDRNLTDVMKQAGRDGFVLVENARGEVNGIVTSSDLADIYLELTEPFVLVGELDQVLRRILSMAFELPELLSSGVFADGRAPTSFDHLTMGHYERVLGNPALWDRLGWSLDRKTFISRLRTAREVRNNLMHFNPGPLPDNALDDLRTLIAMLRYYGLRS